MKCVKRYFLSIFMLQTCSLFSMQFKDFDPTISFNGTTNNSMCSLQKFTGSIHSNKYNYMDYVHDVIAENIEKQNSKFKKLCDRIDEQHLALDKNAWFKGVRG